jgi:hypothetical protein
MQACEEIGAPSGKFNQCLDRLDQTVILSAKSHQGSGRIGLLIAPYASGP